MYCFNSLAFGLLFLIGLANALPSPMFFFERLTRDGCPESFRECVDQSYVREDCCRMFPEEADCRGSSTTERAPEEESTATTEESSSSTESGEEAAYDQCVDKGHNPMYCCTQHPGAKACRDYTTSTTPSSSSTTSSSSASSTSSSSPESSTTQEGPAKDIYAKCMDQFKDKPRCCKVVDYEAPECRQEKEKPAVDYYGSCMKQLRVKQECCKMLNFEPSECKERV